MPILACQPDIFPADLLDGSPLAESGATWWALYTMSRREKQLMRHMLAAKLPFYAPLVESRKRSPGGRVRTAYAPLFPGYVFALADPEQRRAALTTNCVSRALPVPAAQQLVEDLRQIQLLIDSNLPLIGEARLLPGQRVRVCSGSLQGIEGTIVKHHGQHRLLVAVQFLQQGASVQIDESFVESI